MQTTLIQADQKQLHQKQRQYIPTFIVVCNANGKIDDDEFENYMEEL